MLLAWVYSACAAAGELGQEFSKRDLLAFILVLEGGF
jgi:hypothetical protein